jgi:site-specific DNA-methyltransferase (adenine-specific)
VSTRERNDGLTDIKNNHPTVKSIKLMEYLIKLITPPDGIVCDPFLGSGSTGVAAINLGFHFIGIEKDPEFVKIAKARCQYTCDQLKEDNK